MWNEDEQGPCPTGPAGQLGLRATCAVPCLLDGRIVAVVQYCAFDVRPVDHRWLRMFEQFHRVAVDIIARRRQPGSVT